MQNKSINKYTSYKKARDAAWQLIIDMNINELPVKVSSIIRNLGIGLYTYQDNEDTIKKLGLDKITKTSDGFTLLMSNQYKVFYDSSKSNERIRFTLAHELGHIICKHEFQPTAESYITTRNTEPSINDNPIETEANMFAARLLAPACVLHELKLFTAEEIAEHCCISQQAAEFRCQRLLLLEKRNKQFLFERDYGCYYISNLEKQVKEQFSNYINNHL
ncbi:MAG: ImmA/IrrE family metallo-endopeptidase [Eubacterium sp.]|nr:ImmA/IrrE family metallo-endopeptidase [Eubacterium sp.]